MKWGKKKRFLSVESLILPLPLALILKNTKCLAYFYWPLKQHVPKVKYAIKSPLINVPFVNTSFCSLESNISMYFQKKIVINGLQEFNRWNAAASSAVLKAIKLSVFRELPAMWLFRPSKAQLVTTDSVLFVHFLQDKCTKEIMGWISCFQEGQESGSLLGWKTEKYILTCTSSSASLGSLYYSFSPSLTCF